MTRCSRSRACSAALLGWNDECSTVPSGGGFASNLAAVTAGTRQQVGALRYVGGSATHPVTPPRAKKAQGKAGLCASLDEELALRS